MISLSCMGTVFLFECGTSLVLPALGYSRVPGECVLLCQ